MLFGLRQTFLCTELGQCKYHPEAVVYPGIGAEQRWHGIGLYPCCNQKVLRFDPSSMPKVCVVALEYVLLNSNDLWTRLTLWMPVYVLVQGCKIRDHIVSATDGGDCGDHNVNSTQTRILNDLLLHREAVCVPERSDYSNFPQKKNNWTICMPYLICLILCLVLCSGLLTDVLCSNPFCFAIALRTLLQAVNMHQDMM